MKRRLKKVSGGFQVGVTSLHLLIAVILSIASLVLLIWILPSYIEIQGSGDDEHENVDDEEKKFVERFSEVFEGIGRAFTVLFFFLSIFGIIMGLTLTCILSFILIGNIKNLRSRKRDHQKIGNFFLIALDSLIITGLGSTNIWLFNDIKTRLVVGLIMFFWILMICITISHIIIIKKTDEISY